MDSVNKHVVRQRVSLVYDTMAGAQLQSDGVKKYTKSLLESVGLKDETAGDAQDFFNDFGKGL